MACSRMLASLVSLFAYRHLCVMMQLVANFSYKLGLSLFVVVGHFPTWYFLDYLGWL